jgi:hypothetical protein
MKIKTIFFSLGWLLFLSCLALAGAALYSPRVADGLLWRFERFERLPSINQRSFEVRMERYFLWFENFVEPNKAIFFGDSHLQLIPPASTDWAVNFAVNGQQISRMIDRVPKFSVLSTAPTIFINGGENDLNAGAGVEEIAAYWKELLSKLPKTKKLICVGLPETAGERRKAEQVKKLNVLISTTCIAAGARFLPLKMGEGPFIEHRLADDHVHLSRPAMFQLAKVMQQMAEQP